MQLSTYAQKDYATYFNTKKSGVKKLPPNTIFFDRRNSVEIEPIEGVRWLNVGDAGSGKSIKNAIELAQFKNVLFFDPTKKFFQTILKVGDWIENQLNDRGEARKFVDKWHVLTISPNQNESNLFKMNVRDLHPRCLDSIFWRMEDSDKATARRQLLQTFFMRKEKTYVEWKELCEEHKGLTSVFNDLDWILDKNDAAPDLEALVHGAKIIDISEISTNNCCVGVFMQALMAKRKPMPDSYVLSPSNFVVIALDEAQDWCTNNSPVGIAFADVNTQGRKYGLGQILTGSAWNKLHIDVKTKSNMQFVFKSKGMTSKYRNSSLDILPEEWDNLQKYGCFVFSSDGRFNGPSNGDKCLPSIYFVEQKINNAEKEYVVRKHKTSFSNLFRSVF